MPRTPLRPYGHAGEIAAAQLAAGLELGQIAEGLLRDLYGPAIVVRSVRIGAGVPLDSALQTVMSVLPEDDAVRFGRMWKSASVAAATARDVGALVDHLSPGYFWADEWDLRDAFDTIVVERVVDAATGGNGITWLQEQLVEAGGRPRGLQVHALVAADRLGCPEPLIPQVLAAALAFDASSCRVPIAVLARNQGPGYVRAEFERLRRSPVPGDWEIASKWSYWMRVDGWLNG